MILTRAVLGLILTCLMPSAAARALDTEVPVPVEKLSEPPCNDFTDRQHLVGAVLDFGGGHASLGGRYLHAHRSGSDCGPHGGLGWLAYGMDLRMNDGEAGVTHAIGRAGFFVPPSGVSIEGGIGAGTNFEQETIGIGFVGLLFSMYFLEFGATYHVFLGSNRPEWLPSLQFALRVHIPVFTYAKRTRVVTWR